MSPHQDTERLASRSAAITSAAGVCRVPGSAEALSRLLAARYSEPFAWGSHDCCLLAADAIAAQVGIDPARGLRGRYATALQARRVIAMCGGSLEAIATAALGDPLRAPLLACAGDIGRVRSATTDADCEEVLAVCAGQWWAVPTRQGLGMRPLSAGIQSWRVGCG